jgi:hypothetical protein
MALILQDLDSVETPGEGNRFWHEFMRGFYGADRASRHACNQARE